MKSNKKYRENITPLKIKQSFFVVDKTKITYRTIGIISYSHDCYYMEKCIDF